MGKNTVNKVRLIKEALGIDTAELARNLKLPYMTVKNWEERNSLPKMDKAVNFEKYIPNFNPAYFISNDADMFKDTQTGNGKETDKQTPPRGSQALNLPIYSRIAAGVPVQVWDKPDEFIEISHDVLKKLKTKDVFAFKIAGDSMIPRFRENDIVITRKLDLDNRERPKERDFVVSVFKYEQGTSEANLKLFKWRNKEKKEFVLDSLNAYEPSPPIIGTFKDIRYMFKVYLLLSEISYNEKT